MRKLIRNILLYLNIIVAVALLLSYTAVHISPEKFTLPAFFGLAYPYILLANILFLLFWIVKLRREAIISFVVIMLGITHLNNYIRFGTRRIEDYSFSLLSYNIRLFNHLEGNDRSDNNVIELLKKENPDIICMQEFYLDGTHADIKNNFEAKLNKDYQIHYKSLSMPGRRFYGIVTLSSFPIINRGDVVHPNSSSLTIFSDIVIGADTIRVYNNHLQSFRLRRIKSSFLEEISGREQNDLMREIRSLSVSLKEGFIQRAKQSMVLRKHIENSPYPVIVCGDFNDTPVSYSYRKIRKNLKDAFVEAGNGAGFTYRDKYPPNRIDYILYSGNIFCTGFSINRVKFSDHYPISGYFRIKN